MHCYLALFAFHTILWKFMRALHNLLSHLFNSPHWVLNTVKHFSINISIFWIRFCICIFFNNKFFLMMSGICACCTLEPFNKFNDSSVEWFPIRKKISNSIVIKIKSRLTVTTRHGASSVCAWIGKRYHLNMYAEKCRLSSCPWGVEDELEWEIYFFYFLKVKNPNFICV